MCGEMIPFVYACGMRLIGYRLGKNYRKLPEKLVLGLTGNRTYWEIRKSTGAISGKDKKD